MVRSRLGDFGTAEGTERVFDTQFNKLSDTIAHNMWR